MKSSPRNLGEFSLNWTLKSVRPSEVALPREVLLHKGFDPGWVHRVMGLVSGGQTAITINGEVGNFFRNGRGVRQGDPLSPILFNYVVEALAAILDAAKAAGYLCGLVPHLIPGGYHICSMRMTRSL